MVLVDKQFLPNPALNTERMCTVQNTRTGVYDDVLRSVFRGRPVSKQSEVFLRPSGPLHNRVLREPDGNSIVNVCTDEIRRRHNISMGITTAAAAGRKLCDTAAVLGVADVAHPFSRCRRKGSGRARREIRLKTSTVRGRGHGLVIGAT